MTSVRHPASLRDPAGYLVRCGARLVRVIRPDFVGVHQTLLTGPWVQGLCQSGAVSGFRVLPPGEAEALVGPESAGCLCLEHDVIGFPSFPSEWPLEMLCAAAGHTIQLCLQAPAGAGLKDATPFNVLFQGPRPVFVDVLSFEARDVHDPTWLAHGQFVRSFLLPALLDAHYGIPCHTTFLARRDGVEPEDAYRLLGPLARITPPFLGNVTMPVLLSARAERDADRVYAPKRIGNAEQAAFILHSLFSQLSRAARAASARRHRKNIWSTYTATCTYTSTGTTQKTAFVEKLMQESRPARVLDVGCNTGDFSFVAARSGAEVVAIDLDPEVVGSLWQRARDEKAGILPLVVQLARPTPALGWRNQETPSFLQRAEGYFDALLMLAVVHHLLVTDQIPLADIIEQAARLTTKWLVTEFVAPEDPQFKRLTRGREALYAWLDRPAFEAELGRRFEVVRQEQLADTGRWLYLAVRRDAH